MYNWITINMIQIHRYCSPKTLETQFLDLNKSQFSTSGSGPPRHLPLPQILLEDDNSAQS